MGGVLGGAKIYDGEGLGGRGRMCQEWVDERVEWVRLGAWLAGWVGWSVGWLMD